VQRSGATEGNRAQRRRCWEQRRLLKSAVISVMTSRVATTEPAGREGRGEDGDKAVGRGEIPMTDADQKTILIVEDSRTQFLHLQTDYSRLSKSLISLVRIVKIQAARTKKASNTSAVLLDLSI
jgi:hypothetical protein